MPKFSIGEDVGVRKYLEYGTVLDIKEHREIYLRYSNFKSPIYLCHGDRYYVRLEDSKKSVWVYEDELLDITGSHIKDDSVIAAGHALNGPVVYEDKHIRIMIGVTWKPRVLEPYVNIYLSANDAIYDHNAARLSLVRNAYLSSNRAVNNLSEYIFNEVVSILQDMFESVEVPDPLSEFIRYNNLKPSKISDKVSPAYDYNTIKYT